MKIAEYAVKNYQFTLIMFLMAIALGVTTLFTMPRSEDPEILNMRLWWYTRVQIQRIWKNSL
jgi:multidrug efflux pump subunit AcrB